MNYLSSKKSMSSCESSEIDGLRVRGSDDKCAKENSQHSSGTVTDKQKNKFRFLDSPKRY